MCMCGYESPPVYLADVYGQMLGISAYDSPAHQSLADDAFMTGRGSNVRV